MTVFSSRFFKGCAALMLGLWLALPSSSKAVQILPLDAVALGEACSSIDPSALCLSGYVSLRMTDIPPEQRHLTASWQRVLDTHNPKTAFGEAQPFLSSHNRQQWNNLSAQMPGISPDKKLRYINGFFNNFSSKSDQDIYGTEEYWATPEEFLEHKGGDCEDYAITKYLALRYFNWPAEDMWILIARKHSSKQRHAVLAVRFGAQTFILDNLSRPVYQLVPEQSFLKGFTPLFALNEAGFWFFAGTGAEVAATSTLR